MNFSPRLLALLYTIQCKKTILKVAFSFTKTTLFPIKVIQPKDIRLKKSDDINVTDEICLCHFIFFHHPFIVKGRYLSVLFSVYIVLFFNISFNAWLLWEQIYTFILYTVFPSLMVSKILISFKSSLKGFLSRITKSAFFPVVIVPFSFSS